MSDDQDSSTPTASAGSQHIKHMPRTRAVGPRFDALPEFKAESAPVARPAADAQLANPLMEPRIGPLFVKYSVWAGGTAIAYTYLAGFRAWAQDNNAAWMHTFRQRVWIMSPLIALYCTGTGMIPMPFRSQIEQALGRKAFTLLDFNKAEKEVKQQRKADAAAAEQAASDAFADKHLPSKV